MKATRGIKSISVQLGPQTKVKISCTSPLTSRVLQELVRVLWANGPYFPRAPEVAVERPDQTMTITEGLWDGEWQDAFSRPGPSEELKQLSYQLDDFVRSVRDIATILFAKYPKMNSFEWTHQAPSSEKKLVIKGIGEGWWDEADNDIKRMLLSAIDDSFLFATFGAHAVVTVARDGIRWKRGIEIGGETKWTGEQYDFRIEDDGEIWRVFGGE